LGFNSPASALVHLFNSRGLLSFILTNRGYKSPFLSVLNSLYAFTVFSGDLTSPTIFCKDSPTSSACLLTISSFLTKALKPFLATSPTTGTTPKTKDAKSIPAALYSPFPTLVPKLIISLVSLTPGIKSVAVSTTSLAVGLNIPFVFSPAIYLSKKVSSCIGFFSCSRIFFVC